jgi:hypothetical protein
MLIHDSREGIHLQPDAATRLRAGNFTAQPVYSDWETVLASWTTDLNPLPSLSSGGTGDGFRKYSAILAKRIWVRAAEPFSAGRVREWRLGLR